jgi:glycosyltransferase involved in cell wall biosynthesis
MSAPQISVVIPTHDRRDLLMLTLRTVLWQEGIELEVIVVDDGSHDGTLDAVKAIGDARVRCLRHETPQGVSTARNRGIDDAHGEWIAFLDDDDLWAATKLRTQLEAAARANATWCYAGAVKIDATQRVIGGTPPSPPGVVTARLPSWNLVPGGCSGVVANRDALRSAGTFDPRLVNLADWDLWIRLARTGDAAYVPEPLVGYRIHGGQASLDVGLILREAAMIDGRYGSSIDRGALHHYLGHKSLLAGSKRRALQQFAAASVHGHVRPVVTDTWSIFRARIAGRPARGLPDADARWRMQAESWLHALVVDFRVGGQMAPER